MTAATCMFPGCDAEAHIRGLCKNHYTSARQLVKDGHTTWEVLEQAGKCLPKSKSRAGTPLRGKNQQHFLTPEQLEAAQAKISQ